MTTKAQALEIEEKAIKEFRNKLEELCKEYGVQAVCIGTRNETEKFEDEPTQSCCAAFVGGTIKNPSYQEARALAKAYEEAENIFEEIQLRAMFRDVIKDTKEKCDCDDCKQEEKATEEQNAEQEITTPFQDENGPK